MPPIDQNRFLQNAAADPAVLDNFFAVERNRDLTVVAPGILGNDRDAEGGALVTVLISDIADNGDLSVFGPGNFSYTPDTNFTGTDSFTYRARDEDGNTSEAVVTFTVFDNPAPLAFGETYSVMRNGSLSVAAASGLLVNDIDPDGGSVSVSLITTTVSNGSLSAFAPGNFTYTPDSSFVGVDSFTYRIRDEEGNTATATATINVVAPAAPIALGETFVTREGQALSVSAPGILLNDLDPSGDGTSVTLITDTVDDGSLSAFAPGNFTYTPDNGFTGTDSFTYRIRNDSGEVAQATANIVVVADLPPLARDETYSVQAGDSLIIGSENGLLKNDADPEGNGVSVALITDTVDNGTLSAFSSGNFNYTPDRGFTGTDSFTYRIRDDHGNTATATATIHVVANPGPQAFDDTFAVLSGSTLSVSAANGLLQNDIDPDGGSPTVALITDVTDNGSLSAFANGNFTYTPDSGFVGVDSFTYRIVDEDGNTATATASITVAARPFGIFPIDPVTPSFVAISAAPPVYRAAFDGPELNSELIIALPGQNPIASDDSYTLLRNASLDIGAANGVLANDIEPRGTDLSVVLITNPTDHGSVSVFGDGRFTYTPDAGFTGTDSFTYRMRDEDGDTDEATVTLNVVAPAAPVATDDSYSVDPGTLLTVDAVTGLLANDYDQTDQDLSVVLITDTVDNGTVSVFGQGNFTYTPDAGFSGIDSFTYRIRDEDGATAEATVELHVRASAAPVANPDSYSVLRNGTLDVAASEGVLTNDLDPEGTDLSVVLITDPVDNGSVNVFGDGRFTYTPDSGFVGTDSFTYRVRDGEGSTSEATVTIEVVAPTPPVATDDSYSVYRGDVLTVDAVAGLLANDIDQTGQDLNVVLITDAADNGNVTAFGSGNFTYTPDAGFTGTDSFTYRIRDEDGGTAEATATINVVARPAPLALDDLYSVDEDQVLTVDAATGLLFNDVDPSGGDLNVVLISDTTDHGALQVFGPGNFTYTPDADYSGYDSFTYRIRSEFGETAEATVHLAVNPVNDRPLAVSDVGFVARFQKPLQINVSDILANDTDPDGDTLSIISVSGGKGGTAALKGDLITFTPLDGFTGPTGFTYTISDGNGARSTASVSIDVVANTPPVARDDTVITDEDTPVYIPLLDNDVDADGDLLTVSLGNPLYGTVVYDGEGYLYTPYGDFNGKDGFDYAISDGHGGTAKATVLIKVNPVNDAPVIAFAGPYKVKENTQVVGGVDAIDPEGDALDFALAGDDADLFRIDGTTGDISFRTAPDFEMPGSKAGTNLYSFTLVVSDGVDKAAQDVSVEVTDVVETTSPNPVSGTAGSDRNVLGTEEDDIINTGAGRSDTATGLGGADIFDFSTTTTNGVREIRRITDFDAGEGDLIDIGAASITSMRTIRDTTYLYLDQDRDLIILQNVTDFDTDSLL